MAKQTGSGRIRIPRIDLAKIYLLIAEYPGCKIASLREKLGLDYAQVLTRLVAMERVGLLLSEDDKGRLWPYSCGGFNDYQSIWS